MQDGGLEKHTHISASDEDFTPNFERLVRLATKDIFKLAHQFGEDVDDFYDDESCDKMTDKELIEVIVDDEI